VTGPASPARIFLRRGATDMRKGFDGLSGLVRETFGREPSDGSLFVFVSRRRDMLKALYWDRDGFALWSKRLERGRFAAPAEGPAEIGRADLALLLEGVTVRVIRRSPRWRGR
jgi:transposase